MFKQCQSNQAFRKMLATLPVVEGQKRTVKLEPVGGRIELPCVYRSENPMEWAACGCHVYDCEIHDRCVPWRKPKLIDGIKVCYECKDRKAESKIITVPIPNATICITHWIRPAALERLLKSIEQHLPGVPVLLDDTQGNVSASRNRLAAKCPTKYYIMFEDDFIVRPDTAKGLADAISILEYDPTIAGVGGTCVHQHKKRSWGHNFIRRGNVMDIQFSNRPTRKTPSGVSYVPCDLILNFGVFRNDLFKQVPWDERFEIGEHQHQFWKFSQAHFEFAFHKSLLINHWHEIGPKQYRNNRRRSSRPLMQDSYGFTFKRTV